MSTQVGEQGEGWLVEGKSRMAAVETEGDRSAFCFGTHGRGDRPSVEWKAGGSKGGI